MDHQPQTPQRATRRDSPVDRGPGQDPHTPQTPQGRPALTIGTILVRTVIHFFPKFREWLNEVPDPRDPVRTVYNQRFLLWISLFLFVCKLGSRRQIDYEFRDGGPLV